MNRVLHPNGVPSIMHFEHVSDELLRPTVGRPDGCFGSAESIGFTVDPTNGPKVFRLRCTIPTHRRIVESPTAIFHFVTPW